MLYHEERAREEEEELTKIRRRIGVRKAAARKLTHELGIPQAYELDEFAYLTRIHYYAPSDEIWAEHESEFWLGLCLSSLSLSTSANPNATLPTVDYILFLAHDPTINVSPNEVSDTKWVSKADLEAFFQDPGSSSFPSLLTSLT